MVYTGAAGPSRVPYTPTPGKAPSLPATPTTQPGANMTGPPPAVATPTLPGQANGMNVVSRADSDFHPGGFQMPSVGRGGPTPNGNEMAESLLKIVEALKTLQPDTGDGFFADVLDKLSKITHQLGQMPQPSKPEAESQPPQTADQADPPAAAPASPDTPAPMSTNDATTDIQSPAESGPEQEPKEVVAPEIEGAEPDLTAGEPGEQTDPPPNPDVEGTSEPGHPGEQGVANAEVNPVKPTQAEAASATLARLQDKNVQRLLENLLGREMYKQLCEALHQQH